MAPTMMNPAIRNENPLVSSQPIAAPVTASEPGFVALLTF
jgi:hypothetical protein